MKKRKESRNNKNKLACGENRPRLATPIHTNRTCDVCN